MQDVPIYVAKDDGTGCSFKGSKNPNPLLSPLYQDGFVVATLENILGTLF